MATPTAVRGMTAVSKDSSVKPLGYIVWFSVPDEDAKLSRVKRLWGLAGLDIKSLPSSPREVDAFKRAVRAEEGRVETQDGTIVETDVRDVLNNAEDVIYQVSRVVRDRANRVVEYPKALRVWYSKVTGELGFKALGDVPRKDVLPIMESIQEHFDAASKTITGAKVRGLVRNFIKEDDDERAGLVGLSGENMRGKAGGVYFVLAKYSDQLDSLSEFLSELYPSDRAYLYTVPLADGASERELIRRHHVTNCVAEMESAIKDAAALIRDDRERGIRENVAQHHWQKLERFRRRAAQYTEALNEEQDELNAHLDLLNLQLRKLVGA